MLETKFESVAPVKSTSEDDDSAHPLISEEPILALDSIQGNLIGFNKDYQTFLFLKITDPKLFLDWLRTFIPFVATAAEVLQFNRLYKKIRRRRGGEDRTVRATWINLAFSFRALKALSPDAEALSVQARDFLCYRDEDLSSESMEAEKFKDLGFRDGLAERAVWKLNDPSSETAEGNPRNWLFGGPGNEADVVIIVAGDTSFECDAEVKRIERSLFEDYRSSGTKPLFKQPAATLPQPNSGREHFGFLDGVSQPGLRGRVSSDPNDFLTMRENPSDPNHGKPGQELVWPGEFIFGYRRQMRSPIPEHESQLNTTPGMCVKSGPVWAKDGSYLVVRRLRQDVAAFRKFISDEAAKRGMDREQFAAKLVGRWPSSAPIILSPEADDLELAQDEKRKNNFGFHQLPGDQTGAVCPFAAHIRKVNPREDQAAGRPGLNITNTQWHRLLRRGIPFGAPYDLANNQDDGNRGLVFAAYMTSILDQFEFVVNSWANEPNFKDGLVDDVPPSGHDPIIGQVNNDDGSRTRQFALPLVKSDGKIEREIVTTDQDWVIPTGGGYFFSPSIDALCLLSGADRA